MIVHRSVHQHVKKADFPIAADLHRRLAVVADEVAAALKIPPSKVSVYTSSMADTHWVIEGRTQEDVNV